MFTTISISGVDVIIFRDDLNHATVSGNKLHKLRPNIDIAQANSCSTILSFGGPFSNHLHALAWACNVSGLKSIGVVRGELHEFLTPTLKDCQQWGMKLVPAKRQSYRQYQEILTSLEQPCFASDLGLNVFCSTKYQQENTLVIPEGGSNKAAIQSVAKAYAEIFKSTSYDSVQQVSHAVCATGTGATLAGLYQAAPKNVKVIGMQAVAEHDATRERVYAWLGCNSSSLEIVECHLGRFGKNTPELTSFIDEFEQKYDIPLDQVYNGKAMLKLLNMIEVGYFKSTDRILYIHTGGLQGNRA